jgi:TonB-dependent receptor
MIYQVFFRWWKLFPLCLLPASVASGAIIAGQVYDVENDIFLESARISVAGTGISTYSQRGGRYRLTNVPAASHTLIVTVTGYPTLTQEVTVHDDNDELTVNFNLTNENVFQLDEFVVEGTLIGQAKSLNIRRSSAELREVVASDAFGQFADRNPGEALQRVAGITVESDQGEGSFLLIRGASPDLSAVQIDGVALATPQEDGRRVNLNVITVDQLERIEVSKTWLPRQKGGVIGGTVDLITRSALDRGERFASVETAATHREVYDDKISYRGAITYGDIIDSRNWKWLGDAVIGIQFSVNGSKDYSGSDTLAFTWLAFTTWPHQYDPAKGEEPLYGYKLGAQNLRDFAIIRERLGMSLRLELRLTERHEFYVSASQNEFRDIETEQISYVRSHASETHVWAGTKVLTQDIVNKLGLDPNDPFVRGRLQGSITNRSLTFNEAIALGELGYDPLTKQFTEDRWPLTVQRAFAHTLRDDEITTYQMGGKHRSGSGSTTVDWKLYGSDASQVSTEHTLRLYMPSEGAGTSTTQAGSAIVNPRITEAPGVEPLRFSPAQYTLAESTTSEAGPAIRKFTSNDERRGGEANIEHLGSLGSVTIVTRAGVALDTRDKSYLIDYNRYVLRVGGLDRTIWTRGALHMDHAIFNGGDITGFEDNFGSHFFFGPSFNPESTLAFLKDPAAYGAFFSQSNDALNDNFTSKLTTNYESTEDITGYYFQQSLQWGKWTLIYGARYENTANTFTNLEIITRSPKLVNNQGVPRFINPATWRLLRGTPDEGVFSELVTSRKGYNHLLPALHLRYDVTENITVRSSITKTIARPLFSDLIPREIPEISGSNFAREVRLPAFDLRPMEAVNYDISVDYFIKPIGIISAAVFYKDLDGPIYDEVRYEVGPNVETAPIAAKYVATGANDSPWTLTRKRNAGNGNLLGAEITFDRKFNFLPGFWNGFGFNSNIAWFDSEATLTTQTRIGEVVPLFRQPDKTANLSLYFDKYGLFARISYNLRGYYLQNIEAGSRLLGHLANFDEPPNSFDIYVKDTNRLDFTLRYQFWGGFQVFFEAINLTNEPLVRYRGNESRPLDKQYTGRIFTLGLKWNL